MSDFDETHAETGDIHEWDITFDRGDKEVYYIFTGSKYGVKAHMKLLWDDYIDGVFDGTQHMSIEAYCDRCEICEDYVPKSEFGRMKLK